MAKAREAWHAPCPAYLPSSDPRALAFPLILRQASGVWWGREGCRGRVKGEGITEAE